MKRFGVSLEEDLLKELDDLVGQHKLPNRSQAIRFLIRRHMVEEKCLLNEKVSGCIVLVYDHHRSGLQKRITEIQHEFHHLVLCSQHVHLDRNNCIETIILKGRAADIRDLSDRLIAVKGVEHGDLVMTASCSAS
ncbi:nickel-responsive transcriptional regulator NikR [Prosthecochloris sp. HL-130-GSB]|jgi:CopG family transcriptional regulator, nickel-responsive regulator|uniref:Putative nickel-responsive regulator n=1 Tax=Prosthecochloris aestuarii TaxID=1102 RepID=A0A831WV09_PROAE|nr:nickel-responsive transcriptional regulator NikR [Prosthecochloris sp. HL-130-GSB]ARM30763.1 nickel-responsive transcriptional regulator NikR [Prosthecochloris sp. HL-130-GSB]HED31271.1 nickel-responsive transcriptional regulator NikR [Prosthecochloris aestuarii]